MKKKFLCVIMAMFMAMTAACDSEAADTSGDGMPGSEKGQGNQSPEGSAADGKEEKSHNFVSWEDSGLEDVVVVWKDEDIEAAVREYLGLSGVIMRSDVYECRELEKVVDENESSEIRQCILEKGYHHWF